MAGLELPDGRSGKFRIVHRPLGFRTPAGIVWLGEPVQALEELRHGQWHCWMSDTIDEAILNAHPLALARGHVLTAGLGMGYFVAEALRRREVQSITVVERDPDVIRLVWPHVGDPRVRLVQDDVRAFLARPGSRPWDLIYLDIWERLSPALIPDMDRIRGLALPHIAPGGTVWCWGQELLEPPAARGDAPTPP